MIINGDNIFMLRLLLLMLLKKNKGFTLFGLTIFLGTVSILGSILFPNFSGADGEAAISGCCENLRNIAAACEMYANDNGGCRPAELTELVRNRMAELPVCPVGAADGRTADRRCFRVLPSPVDCLSCWQKNHNPYLQADFTPSYCPLNRGLSTTV